MKIAVREIGVSWASVALVAVAASFLGGAASADPPCTPKWSDAYGSATLNSDVAALGVYDLGSGPRLYAAGDFYFGSGFSISQVAQLVGEVWQPLGTGLESGTHAYAMTMFDDGSGPAVYVGGEFTKIGGVTTSAVARWNGTSWSPVGSGMQTEGRVRSFAIFDDGTGPALYAAGAFNTAGGVSAHSIARWNGTSWSPLGVGIEGEAYALAVFTDSSGPALYAAGSFQSAGGLPANNIARWNGQAWMPAGAGLNGVVYSLCSYDSGTGAGPKLFAGGDFNTPAFRLAKWDGSVWTGIAPTTPNNTIIGMMVWDDGSGPKLVVRGFFHSVGLTPMHGIAAWDGTSWSPFGDGLDAEGAGMTAYDGPIGPCLLTMGGFLGRSFGDPKLPTMWSPRTGWVPFRNSFSGITRCLLSRDDGAGTRLYVGGGFSMVDGQATPSHIVKSQGDSWSALPGTLSPATSQVNALANFGPNNSLYVGGSFTAVDGLTANRIARWDGAQWHSVVSIIGSSSAQVNVLKVFDNGMTNGPALYVAGDFTNPSKSIGRYNGSTWSALGSGLTGKVYDLEVFDDGTGPALFAAGNFSVVGATTIKHIAKWNGSTWSALGAAPSGIVYCLKTYDDGNGPRLYAGGEFINIGGVSALHIAKWNGSTWSAVGGGLYQTPGSDSGNVKCLAVADDGSGSGPALFASGSFNRLGSILLVANRIAKWDGTAWSNVDGGFDDSSSAIAMSPFDDGSSSGPNLFVAGSIGTAGGQSSNDFAKLTYGGAPSFKSQPVGGQFVTGGVATLSVQAYGTDLLYQWRQDGIPLADNGHVGGSQTATLTIVPVWASDAGTYDVIVSNQCGSLTSDAARVDVLACLGDISPPPSGNGEVDIDDLFMVIRNWGSCSGACPADLNGDDVVNKGDLLLLLSAWGSCAP